MNLDLRQTAEYSRYMLALGWDIVDLTGFVGFAKTIPLIGKILKVQRYGGKINSNSLGGYATVYLEPIEEEPHGFQKAKACFVPSKTIQIDLTKSEETLLKNLKQKTRYNIKVAEKNSVVIKKSRDIGVFLDLWHKEARNRGMWLSQRKEIISLWNSFKATNNVKLYLAHKKSDIIAPHVRNDYVIAGLLVVYTDDAAYYMYAASTADGKKLYAPTLLTWRAVRNAQKAGKKIFDFEGIYDERYENTKGWKGFTKFKEGFGGKIITYPGTFVKYSNLLLKILNF